MEFLVEFPVEFPVEVQEWGPETLAWEVLEWVPEWPLVALE